METLNSSKGVIETLPIEKGAGAENALRLPTGTLAGNGSVEAAPRAPRYSAAPPEVIDVLRNAQDGDRQAFAELHRRYVADVTRYLSARMRERDPDSVPDLVQETFCDALSDLPNAADDVRGWLIRKAAKAITIHDRSNRRYIRAAYVVREMRAAKADVEPRPPIGRMSLIHGLARLMPARRQAIQLRFLDDLPRITAGEIMGQSTEAVKALERRGLCRSTRSTRRYCSWGCSHRTRKHGSTARLTNRVLSIA